MQVIYVRPPRLESSSISITQKYLHIIKNHMEFTQCRLTAEIMMEEIGRRPGGGGGGEYGNTSTQGSAVSQDREGYALAAGLALGLITLGQGRAAVGLSDLHIEDRLR